MKKALIKKTIVAGALGVALVGVGEAAFAGYQNEAYDVIAPKLQFAAYTGPQEKAYTARDGYATVNFVGSTYKVNLQMCNYLLPYCGGTQVFGIDEGGSAYLENNYNDGTDVTMRVVVSTTNAVNVQVQGYWRSD